MRQQQPNVGEPEGAAGEEDEADIGAGRTGEHGAGLQRRRRYKAVNWSALATPSIIWLMQ